MASAGKRQHQVPLIGIGQCHAMTASNQVNFYTLHYITGECEATERGGGEAMASDADDGDGDAARRTAGVSDRQARAGVASAGKRHPTTTTNHDEWFECENGSHLRQAIK